MARKQKPNNTKRENKKKSKKKKTKYKVRNWHEYNEALKQRGALDVWVDKDVLEKWMQNQTENREPKKHILI